MRNFKIRYEMRQWALVVCTILFLACNQQRSGKKTESAVSVPSVTGDTSKKGYSDRAGTNAASDSGTATVGSNTNPVAASENDDKEFDEFYARFKKAIVKNSESQLADMIYFPLQTAMVWENEDFQKGMADSIGQKINKDEFHQYYENIFNAEVKKFVPRTSEDDISKFVDVGKQDYYARLQKLTDKGSAMYEVYMQYSLSKTTARGSYFGFVFGKVNGKYKALSYYSKWPVKG